MLEKVPGALKQLRQWICWKFEGEPGELPRKIPKTVDGNAASTTNPSTWSSYEVVEKAAPAYSGAGFVFTADDPYCGIDFDGCLDPDSGEVSAWAYKWLRKLNSYCEVSPSGTGVKVWIKGKLPFETGKKVFVQAEGCGGKKAAVEAYDHARYFAVTGMRLVYSSATVEERQAELDELCKEFFRPEPVESAGPAGPNSRLSVIERARRYMDTVPGAISGQGGHNATFRAACVLLCGFGLTKAEARVLMSEWNRRCEPPWSERDLDHKISDADKQSGPRGYLRDAKEGEWQKVKIPEYVAPAPPEKKVKPKEEASGPTVVTLKDATHRFLETLEKDGQEKLLSTGIDVVDAGIGGGMALGEMVIAAARPSHGKSAFGLQVCDACARAGLPTAIVSEEMSAIMLAKRTILYATPIGEPYWKQNILRVRTEMEEHFQSRTPCYIVEGCRSSFVAYDEARKLVETKGVRLVVIDYAQLLSNQGKSRYEQITHTSLTLRRLASDLKITVLALCQLSREIESRESFSPQLSDLKESGQLEQDSDVVFFLVWLYLLNQRKPKTAYQVWVGKNRNREIVSRQVNCEFDPSRQTIFAGEPEIVENVVKDWRR